MLPLDGFRVGVSADRRVHEQADYLRNHGATVVAAPTVRTVLADLEALEKITRDLIASPPDLIVATSAIGIRNWMTHATSWGLDHELRASLSSARIIAVGLETVGELAAAELEATLRSEDDTDALAHVLRAEASGDTRAAVQLDGDVSPDAVSILKETGASVESIATYRWALPEDRRPGHALIRAACKGRLHAITFTTPAAVHGAFELAGELKLTDALVQSFELGVVAACVGPQAAKAAKAVGIAEPLVPVLPRLAYMLRDLTDRLAQGRKTLSAAGSTAIIQGELVCVDDERLALSTRERALFDALAERPGEVVSKDELLRRVWSRGRNRHLVEVTVARLRERLGPAMGPAIIAVRRRGYRLDARPVPSSDN